MYFASTPVIALKSSGCLPCRECPRAGRGGQLIGFRRAKASPPRRPRRLHLLDEAETALASDLRHTFLPQSPQVTALARLQRLDVDAPGTRRRKSLETTPSRTPQ